MSNGKLVNAVIVFITPDVERTANYYREVLGFRVVEHFDKEGNLPPFTAMKSRSFSYSLDTEK